jgi:hypothetical protein
MPLAEEVLIWAGLDVPQGHRLAGDDQIVTTCPTCRTEQSLTEASVSHGDETAYTCKNGCQAIFVVRPSQPGALPWEGRGYAVGDWMLRNPADLFVPLIDQQGRPIPGLFFEAAPAALADESERPLDPES